MFYLKQIQFSVAQYKPEFVLLVVDSDLTPPGPPELVVPDPIKMLSCNHHIAE